MAVEDTFVQPEDQLRCDGYTTVAIARGQVVKHVGIHTDGRNLFAPVAADTDIAYGIAAFTVEANNGVDIAYFGKAVAFSHGNITAGAYLVPSTNGRVKTATGVAAGKSILGRALTTTTGDGKFVGLLLGVTPSLTV